MDTSLPVHMLYTHAQSAGITIISVEDVQLLNVVGGQH
jgi:hypothetical protein